MNNFFLREEGLMPEQKDVILKAKGAKGDSKIICVQGVAGSGKTTIALNVSSQIGESNKNRSDSQKQTILFLTYNQSLADNCYQALKNKPDLEEVLTPRGELKSRMINVLTIQELFKFILTEDEKAKMIEDIDCIGQLGKIAANRGITDLLPSQIFALITTFLRGRKELIWKNDPIGNLSKEKIRVSDLEAIIVENERRSNHYRIFKEPLLNISKQLLKTYEDWKDDRLDRSDIARVFYEQISAVEQHLINFCKTKAEDYRKLWMGKGDESTRKIVEWLIPILNQFQNFSEIEEAALHFRNLFSSQRINQNELDELTQKLFLWIEQYGLPVDPIWSRLISKLPNPVIIIDEVQDLSSIECENLISLWFQLARSKESRLILLGDLNQQMTPSGFEWDNLVQLIKQKQSIYKYKKNSNEPDINDPLDWNFRTTPEIAKAVADMLRQVSEKSLSQDDSRRLLKHSIDPKKTILGDPRLSELVNQLDKDHLIPRLLIGSSETFEVGLRKYLDRLRSVPEDENEDRYFSMVIITEHANELTPILGEYKQKTNFPLTAIEIIPVLSCKGLEFDRCVLYGINRLDHSDITIDILSRWYTSFTRARIQLLVYLTPEEYQFIRQTGWEDLKSSVILENVEDPEKVSKELDQIGMTELDNHLLVEFGERAFVEFQSDLKNEKALHKSLNYFRKANQLDYFHKRANQAAELFEGEELWDKAAAYYGQADNIVKEIYCIYKNSLDYRSRGDLEQANKLQQMALEKISSLPIDRRLEKAQAYLLIGKPEQALEEVRSADQALKERISLEVYQLARKSDSEEEKRVYANLLKNYGYFDLAASTYLLINELTSALSCAAQPDAKTLAKVAEDVFNASNEWIRQGRVEEVTRLAGQLEACDQFKFAAELYEKTGSSMLALKAYIKAGDLGNAKSQADKLGSAESYKLLGDAYRQGNRKKWDSAYVYYHKSGDENLVQQMEKELRENQLFLELGNAFKETGQVQKLKELAEWSFQQKEYVFSARCWEMAEDWRKACEKWMYVYRYYQENFERLLGPDPGSKNPHPATLKRFYDHLENNRQRYEYEPKTSAEEPLAYRSMQQSVKLVNQIVSGLSQKDQWRKDLDDLCQDLEKSNKKAGIQVELTIPHKKSPLNEEELKKLWSSIKDALNPYRNHAKCIADAEFNKAGNELNGLEMMKNICHDDRRVEEMVEELGRRKDEQGKRLWVQSWKFLKWSDDEIQSEIENLDPIKDCDLILYAIKESYPDDKQRRDLLRSSLGKKLQRSNKPQAKKLLEKHFPEYISPSRSGDMPSFENEQIKIAQPASIFDLLSELRDKAQEKIMDEDNQEDFDRYMKKLLSQRDEVSKMPERWKKVINSLSEVEDTDVIDLMSRIEQEVLNITKGNIQRFDKTAELPAISSKNQLLNRSSEDASSNTDGDNVNHQAEKQPDNLPSHEIGANRPNPSVKRRRNKKATLRPFSTDQVKILDLHGYSVGEALNQLNQDIATGSRTSTIRCLVVIHGYGKHAPNTNKPLGNIKESVRTRIKNLEKEHQARIYRVIYGENLHSQHPDLLHILEACRDISLDLLRRRNEGMTVIVFK